MKRSGFTLLEVLTVLAVVALLIALVLPVLLRARHGARTVTCLSNLRQLGLATLMYQGDNDGCLPPENPATILYGSGRNAPGHNPLDRYGTTHGLFVCPEASQGKRFAGATDYTLRFVLMPYRLSTGAFEFWRVEPEPGTVLAICKWHLPDPEHLTIGSDGFYQSAGTFQALRADGSVSRVAAKRVQIRLWNWGAFAGHYRPGANVYDLFPGEPWPPRLTQVNAPSP